MLKGVRRIRVSGIGSVVKDKIDDFEALLRVRFVDH